jgi:hypothetical protein
MALRVFPLLETLNRSLQSETMTVSGMMEAMKCVKEKLRERRSENDFNVLLACVNTGAEDLDLQTLHVLFWSSYLLAIHQRVMVSQNNYFSHDLIQISQ